MGLDKLIQAAAVLIILTASTGHIPRLINFVHKAQVQLLQESKASKWGTAMQLEVKK